MRVLLCTAGASLLLATAATAALAEPVAQPVAVEGKTTTLVHDGTTFEVSRGTQTAVFMSTVPKLTQNGRLSFLMLVKNAGKAPIKITEASVTAKSEAGAPVALMTRARLVDEATRHMEAAESNRRNGKVPIMGGAPATGINVGGGTRLAGGSTTAMDKQAQWSGDRDSGTLGMTGGGPPVPDYVKEAEQKALQPAEIAPGQTASTIVTFDRVAHDVSALEVSVNAGPDTHVLRFAVTEK